MRLSPEATSPFLDEFRFLDEVSTRPTAHSQTVASRSPFLSAYEFDGELEVTDPDSEAFVALVNELDDEELHEALLEVGSEFRAIRDEELQMEVGDANRDSRLAEAYLAPALFEIDRLLETAADRFRDVPIDGLTPEDVESELMRYELSQELSPAFENLFGPLKKIAGKALGAAVKVAKTGFKLATTLGLGPIIGRLRQFLPKLLRHWLEKVINQVPASLRPVAQQLAEKYLGVRRPRVAAPSANGTAGTRPGSASAAGNGSMPASADLEPSGAPDTAADPRASVPMQPADSSPAAADELLQEFEYSLAEAVLADDESAIEKVDFAPRAYERPMQDPLLQLDRARAEFTHQISTMRDGTDPAPHVEAFLPAVLPIAARVIGKGRLRSVIVPLVAQLIKNFVGKQHATALAKVLVDKGLRLFNMEAGPDDDLREAAGAVTRTVEETIRRVAELPEYMLDNEELLEGFVLEAFEQSAAANLPVLTEQVYSARPDLRETDLTEGFWTWQPSSGRRHYNKFTKIFDTTISPHVARTVRTFGNQPLASFFSDHYGIAQGTPTVCRLHLYEAIPGTTLPLIGRLEKNVPGLGGSWAHPRFHPLTTAAAGLLLGQPKLGRPLAPGFLASPHHVPVGGRYYYPQILGPRIAIGSLPAGPRRRRRSSQVSVRFDFLQQAIKVFVFLSEADSQEMAKGLRAQSARSGTALVALRALIEGGIRYALLGDARGRVRIVHSAIDPAMARGPVLKRLPRSAHEQLSRALAGTALSSIARFMQQDSQSFISRTEDEADGVTFVVDVQSPLILSKLGNTLLGKASAGGELVPSNAVGSANATIVSGFRRE